MHLLMRCDELWVFLAEGEPVVDGIEVELRLAGEPGIPVRCSSRWTTTGTA
jgi:hypothetical protein